MAVTPERSLLLEARQLIEDLVVAAWTGTHWWEGLVHHEVPDLLVRIDALTK